MAATSPDGRSLTRSRRRAIVIGGGVAGLCAARVLADHFAEVAVLERDGDEEGPFCRPGVPQGRQCHTLLARGRRGLERLFPGFDAAMIAGGAHVLDASRDLATRRLEGWMPHTRPSVELLMASRNLLERVVRGRLLERVNVSLRGRLDVVGLEVAGGAAPVVTGVRARPRGGGEPLTLAADLVVDASGRRSRAPRWLRAAGVKPPEETVVDGFCGYSARWFRAPAARDWPRGWWWKAALVFADEARLATVFPMEGGRWIVSLIGFAGRYPPSDEAGFAATVAALPSPIIARMLALATPISPVYVQRGMANRLRRYERWGRRLGGFIAVGDAFCTLNPVYGHGMTAAVLHAELLGEHLRRPGAGSAGFARSFFAALSEVARPLWWMATGADFRFAETTGRRPPGTRFIARYFDAAVVASMGDPVLGRTLYETTHLLRPPGTFFSPGVVARVGAGALRSRLSRGSAPVPPLPP